MTFRRKYSLLMWILLLGGFLASVAVAAPKGPTQPAPVATPQAVKAPVVVDGQTLFYVRERALSFSPEDRAKAISQRLEKISKNPLARLEAIKLDPGESTTDIVMGERVLMTVTERDAASAGKTRQALAEENRKVLQSALDSLRKDYSIKRIVMGGVFALFATLVLVLFLKGFSILFPRIKKKLNSWRGTKIRSLRFQSLEILPADRTTDLLIGGAKVLRVVLSLLLFYFYIPLILSFFPWTRGFAEIILGYILDPISRVGMAILDYIPNIFFVAVIVLVTRYVLIFVSFIFTELERENISIPGFYSDWAEPTYKIVRFLIIAFSLVVVFPYLPGSQSPAFQGISIFLGVLFSLGSTSAVANVVAGTVLTYMRPFKLGDRVKIADTIGDVVEKTLLVTRIRTIKNVYVTVPNAMVLGSHIINYSSSAQDSGLILHTSVTIGYDAPWRKVHELLLTAAKNTESILSDPKPFILQTSLDDFYVSYELNAYTDQPNKMAKTYSDLHQNIQDAFNKGGVEIMSPHYSALRDGNQVTIPEEHLPKGYKAPGFKVFPWQDKPDKAGE